MHQYSAAATKGQRVECACVSTCWFESSVRTVEEGGTGKLGQLLATSECDGAGMRVLVHLLSDEHHVS